MQAFAAAEKRRHSNQIKAKRAERQQRNASALRVNGQRRRVNKVVGERRIVLGEDGGGMGTQCADCGARERQQLPRYSGEEQHQPGGYRPQLQTNTIAEQAGESNQGCHREERQKPPRVTRRRTRAPQARSAPPAVRSRKDCRSGTRWGQIRTGSARTSPSARHTVSCCASVSDGYIGSEKISRAARSAWGKSPSAYPNSR